MRIINLMRNYYLTHRAAAVQSVKNHHTKHHHQHHLLLQSLLLPPHKPRAPISRERYRHMLPLHRPAHTRARGRPEKKDALLMSRRGPCSE